MHRDELWQEYDQTNTPVMNGGRLAALGNDVDEGHFYGASIVWLYRRASDGLEILFQRRSKNIDRYPGKWDVSCGGHINYQETPIQAALREMTEEIGVEDLLVQDLEFIMTIKKHKGIYAIYAADYTNHKNNFVFADDEVDEVKWVPISAYDDFRKKYGKEPLAKDDFLSAGLINYLEEKWKF